MFMLIMKQNVDNDVSKDGPIRSDRGQFHRTFGIWCRKKPG